MPATVQHPLSILSVRDLSQGMERSRWVSLRTLINVLKISPHGHAQRLICQVILDSVKLRLVLTIIMGQKVKM